MTTPPALTTRELNRATLDRQLLLRRSALSPAETVAHLVGLQTQVPPNHYTALWTRLADFDAEDFSRRFEQREFVRMSMMRCTLHTVTARDALALRPLVQTPHERTLSSQFRRQLSGVDTGRVLERSRELLEERPLSGSELGKILAEEWPDHDVQPLSMVSRHLLPLVQVPPRGLWRRGGLARHTTVQQWLGAELDQAASLDELVLRYLAAFGPASVRDVQMWCGLTRLGEVVERHRAELVTFRDENGTELFDLPDAPRPGADVPAPPRFLPEFDNVFIGHADRSRIHADRRNRDLIWKGNTAYPVFLCDGFIAGTWRIDADRRRTQATLVVRPFADLPRGQRGALGEEGERLLAFHAPGADHDVRWERWDAGTS